MRIRGEGAGRSGRLLGRALVVVVVGTLLLAACGDDDDDAADDNSSDETTGGEDLLGPEDAASGEPVRIGVVSDGATPAYDNTDELRAAEATADYWNAHRAGVGGRPVEVVTCETLGDPAGATDCANQMVEQEVVAVTLNSSAVAESVWEPLHGAGIPTMWLGAVGGSIAGDPESSFLVLNPSTALGALPISVAESENADNIAFVTVDVPQAVDAVEAIGPILEQNGIDHETVAIPLGTADMTSQMQRVADSGAGVVHVVGNDAFCISAFNGLNTVGYEGAVTATSQCITDATREAVSPDVLEGIFILAPIAVGATDDPTYQLYEAVMAEYGGDVEVENAIAMGGYAATGALLTALEGISDDITPTTVTETIKAMPESDLPGGAGITYQCGGSVDPNRPAVCSNQTLRAQLDAEGQPTDFEVVDSSDLVE